MAFIKNEKVFSLSGTSGIVLRGDIKSLWSEFFCYLLIAGFYKEGEDSEGIYARIPNISDSQFMFQSAGYNSKLGRLITEGLTDRFRALIAHPDLNETERDLLGDFNGLFSTDNPSYWDLSAKKILGVANSRDLSPDMQVIAHYVAVTYGQKDFPGDTKLPRLYLSVFGNIHLSKQDEITISEPKIRYRRKERNEEVTALFAFLSTHIDSLCDQDILYPGALIVDMLSTYSFLANDYSWDNKIPITRMSAGLYISAYTGGLDYHRAGSVASRFYQKFLYGKIGHVKIIRQPLFIHILNLMVKKMGDDTHLNHLFPDTSVFRKLVDSATLYGKEPRRSALLEYALEALDSDPETDDGNETDPDPEEDPEVEEESTEEEDSGDLQIPEEDPVTDPSTEEGEFDPSVPPPAMPNHPPMLEKDTIDLISFDKTGEGVNEDLYRSAVVALNDRLKSDNSVPIDVNTKDSLDHWVNGFLYRTSISATKDQIASLGLQKYLKSVSKKG